MTAEEILIEARRRVAADKSEILERAIMTGQWDMGSLVRDAVAQVESELPQAG